MTEVEPHKGLNLELLITELFKAKGYDVRHDVKLIGRSSVEHQIDVYAELKAPLHLSKIIVECKDYSNPVNKDIVMKLVNEVEDLGVDRGILITTSYFTSDAVSLASGYNIDLWDGVKLNELTKDLPVKEIHVPSNLYYIKPIISEEKSIETVNYKLRGIFGKKGEIKSSSIVNLPYYEIKIDARIDEKRGLIRKKVEEKILSSTILMDAITTMICNYDTNDGIVGLLCLPNLTDDEAYVFRILSHSALTTPALASLLSCSTSKARRIVQGLVVKGIAQQIKRGRQILYQSKIKIPDPSYLKFLLSNLTIETGEPKEGVKISPEVSLSNLENIVRLLWKGTIKDYKTIYYPYFACKIIEGNKRYVKVLDMITNKFDERLEKTLTHVYSQLSF